tara:strand:- start:25091 stop:26698 length:1608 start_codon:yes stop_codon:yes gene_type:complete
MRLNKLLIVMLVTVEAVFAQELGVTEVQVVEGFQPSIPDATRLNENAVFADTAERDRSQVYDVLDLDLGSNYKIKPLKAAKVKDDKIPKLYQSKISLGTGYRLGSNVSALYNSVRSEDMSYGILFNHFNNNVKVDDKKAGQSNNNLHLYLKKIKTDKVYIVNLDYSRIGAFTHGNNPTDYNRFAYTKFSSSYVSMDKGPDRTIRDISFFVSDLNELSENHLHLSSNLSKIINDYPFNLKVKFNQYLNYNNKDSEYESVGEKVLELMPSASIRRYDIDLDIGFALDVYGRESVHYFPQINASKELVKDVLLVYGGLRHSTEKNTLKLLSDKNLYIHSYGTNQSILTGDTDSYLQNLEFTSTDELYVSMRNVLGKDEVFFGSISFGEVTDFAHFTIEERVNYNRFIVNYIGSVWQFHVFSNYTKQINDIISLDASVDYFTWDQIVFHKPDLIIKVKTPINLRNKIKAIPSFSYESGRFSREDVLPSLLYLNIRAFYSYSKQLEAYLQLNNLTNSKKELFVGYKDIGFNGVFGISYSF